MRNRWIVYQEERFPLVANAVLIGVLTSSVLGYVHILQGLPGLPTVVPGAAAFLSASAFFVQLRIADEFKDAEDDARYRPQRPVPRGLVTLGELRSVALAAATVQLLMALLTGPTLVWLLLGVWAYLAVMIHEFFVPRWIRRHQLTYLATHMVILPLIVVDVSAFGWHDAGPQVLAGLGWYLAASYLLGVVFEIGRKVRPPDQEQEGVDTYSGLWGAVAATRLWAAAILTSGVAALLAARAIGFTVEAAALLTVGGVVVAVAGRVWSRRPETINGKRLEAASAVWVAVTYAAIGIAPLASSTGRGVP